MNYELTISICNPTPVVCPPCNRIPHGILLSVRFTMICRPLLLKYNNIINILSNYIYHFKTTMVLFLL